MRLRQMWVVMGAIAAGFLGGSLAGVSNAQKAPPETRIIVKAHEFQILDERGDPKLAIAAMGEGWPGIAIARGDTGVGFASLWTLPNGNVVLSIDGVGQNTASLFLDRDGSTRFALGSVNKKTGRVALGLRADGAAYIEVKDKDGKAAFKAP